MAGKHRQRVEGEAQQKGGGSGEGDGSVMPLPHQHVKLGYLRVSLSLHKGNPEKPHTQALLLQTPAALS